MLSTDDVHMSSQIDFTMCNAGLIVALLIHTVFGILCANKQNHVSDIQPLIVNTLNELPPIVRRQQGQVFIGGL